METPSEPLMTVFALQPSVCFHVQVSADAQGNGCAEHTTVLWSVFSQEATFGIRGLFAYRLY